MRAADGAADEGEGTYVASDYEAELQKAGTSREMDASYVLPDGNEITIERERFRCRELLFMPVFSDFEYDGIDKTWFDSIVKCDLWKDLYADVVLSGGRRCCGGCRSVWRRRWSRWLPGTKVEVVAPAERKYAAWVGASIVAALATFPKTVITRGEYDEAGPGIAHRKCPF